MQPQSVGSEIIGVARHGQSSSKPAEPIFTPQRDQCRRKHLVGADFVDYYGGTGIYNLSAGQLLVTGRCRYVGAHRRRNLHTVGRNQYAKYLCDWRSGSKSPAVRPGV